MARVKMRPYFEMHCTYKIVPLAWIEDQLLCGYQNYWQKMHYEKNSRSTRPRHTYLLLRAL